MKVIDPDHISFISKVTTKLLIFSGGEASHIQHPPQAHHRRVAAGQQVLRGEEGVCQGRDAGEAGCVPGQGRVRHQPLQVRRLSD